MAKNKITQKALSAAITKRNSSNKAKCPHCVNGKIGNAVCAACGGRK